MPRRSLAFAERDSGPVHRGQGNLPYRSEKKNRVLSRGQAVPYNINGAPTGADVAAGDKGDITIAGGVWTIDSNVISAYGRTLTSVSSAALARGILELGVFATSTDAANLTGTVAAARIADGSLPVAKISGLGYFATGTDAANLTGTVAAARIADASLPIAKTNGLQAALNAKLDIISSPTTVTLGIDYADLNALFAYLATKRIAAPFTVSIGNAVVTHSAVTVFDHPDAQNIKFVGTTSNVTIGSVGSITSTAAFSHDVVLNLVSAANVVVGNYIYIAAGAITDVASSWLEGTWRVLSKSGNAVTVRVTDRRTSLPSPTVASVAAKARKSILRWDSAINGGLVLAGVATGRFEDIVFDGQYDVVTAPPDNASDGITAATTVHATAGLPTDSMVGRVAATFRGCAVVRWRGNGVYTSGGAVIDFTTSQSCSNGWRGAQSSSGTASIFGKSGVYSGNRKTGASFETNGSLTINNSTIAGNGEQGLYGIGGGSGVATGVKVVGNNTGVEVRNAGFWDIDGAVMRSNGDYQAVVQGRNASINIDSVDTAGALVGAFLPLFGGTFLARSTMPTCAETTMWVSDVDYRGFAQVINNHGEITPNVAYSSPVAPFGGFRLTPSASGGVTISSRATATGAYTDILTLAAGSAAFAGTLTASTFNALALTAAPGTTTGANNVSVGFLAGSALAGAVDRTVNIGRDANRVGTGGDDSICIGYRAGFNSAGAQGTLLGANAGFDVTSGGFNTLLGYNTGRGITTGAQNTIVGANVTGLAAGTSNNVILADGAGTKRFHWDGTNILLNGAVVASGLRSNSGGIGYTTGAGGSVTQITSKSTAVTLNKICGQVTMHGAALAANTAVSFVMNNSSVAAGDRIVVNHDSVGTFGAYMMDARAGAGTITFVVRNLTAGSLSETPVIGFAVIKGVTA